MLKYYINGYEVEDIDDAVEEVLSAIEEEEFEEYIRNEVGDIEIMSLTFDPVEVLREMSPDDFDMAFADWKSEIYDEIERELSDMGDGGNITLYGVDITCEGDDPDELEEEIKSAIIPDERNEAKYEISKAKSALLDLVAMTENIPSLYVDKNALADTLAELREALNGLDKYVYGENDFPPLVEP